MPYSYFDDEDDQKTTELVDLIRYDSYYSDMFGAWMRSCASKGMDEAEALDELTVKLQDFVSGQYDQAYDVLRNAGCDVALKLFMDDGRIDYGGAALELMADDYAGMMVSSRSHRSGSKRTPTRSKSVTSKTTKPRAKAPPKKSANCGGDRLPSHGRWQVIGLKPSDRPFNIPYLDTPVPAIKAAAEIVTPEGDTILAFKTRSGKIGYGQDRDRTEEIPSEVRQRAAAVLNGGSAPKAKSPASKSCTSKAKMPSKAPRTKGRR